MLSMTITVRENSNSFHIGVWCSGSTRDFGSLSIGSSPIAPTRVYDYN